MANAYFTIQRPANDPFKGYLPGSPERSELKAELDKQSHEVVKINRARNTSLRWAIA